MRRGHCCWWALSCAAPGDCALAGLYGFTSDACQGEYEVCPYFDVAAVPFVISQLNGQWGMPQSIPGLAKPDIGLVPVITAVSCRRPGSCAVGGFSATFTIGAISNGDLPRNRAFVATQAGGTWSPIATVPGVPASGVVQSEVDSVICSARCVAIGEYTTASGSAIFATTQR